MISELSQLEKEKTYITSLTCGIKKKNEQTKQNKTNYKLRDPHIIMVVTRREREKLVKGIKIYGNEWKTDFWCGEHEIAIELSHVAYLKFICY